MDAPLCRTCKTRHWGNCARVPLAEEQPPRRTTGPVAQRTERGPSKSKVVGSSPTRPTTPKKIVAIIPPEVSDEEVRAALAAAPKKSPSSVVPVIGPDIRMAQELAREWGKECPVCKARRIKQAEATKRWRAKQKEER